jgi:hypothetical protein
MRFFGDVSGTDIDLAVRRAFDPAPIIHSNDPLAMRG